MEKLAFIVRTILLDEFHTSLQPSRSAFALRKLAESLGTISIDTFESEQKAKAEKRQKNVAQKLSLLEEKKKELKPKAEKKDPKKNAKKDSDQ